MRLYKNYGRFLPLLLTLLALSASLPGCSGKDVSENDPATLYKEAESDISNDRYAIAIEKLKVVKNKFPYSNFAIEAQLKLADVYFMQESFAEAAASYEVFRDLHPKHPKVPYAMYRAAKSYFNDIPNPIWRDMTPAQRALDAYNEFLRRFPSAPEADEARKDMAATRKALADKELSIANFYFKRDFPDSAKPRFEKVIALYPETDAAKEAGEKLQKLGKAQ
jgi:outer membrane protein assembly factor BamD